MRPGCALVQGWGGIPDRCTPPHKPTTRRKPNQWPQGLIPPIRGDGARVCVQTSPRRKERRSWSPLVKLRAGLPIALFLDYALVLGGGGTTGADRKASGPLDTWTRPWHVRSDLLTQLGGAWFCSQRLEFGRTWPVGRQHIHHQGFQETSRGATSRQRPET